MTQANVSRSYITTALVCAAAYLGLAYGAKLVIRTEGVHGLMLDVLALLPTLPIMAFFYAFGRYLWQIDEYRRHRTIVALLIALAIGLSVACGWDFLQAYGGAPAPEPFILTSGFMLLFGVVDCTMKFMDKAGRSA